ncbi:NEQ464 [Nanoarchaeum equitans Kin4-M]|uniref:non-specific serine/threonine protein kinase n=1 Tax=Nanoarchaeum equitans (strain Kin4-M) TaxID=228908 RepID=Q74MY4_NANEQ|nr:NEQ464 [Nanoarchaeum equitans Kin4-M]
MLDNISAAILRQLDYLSKHYEWVPFEQLKKRLDYNEKIIKKKIKELLRKEYIQGIPHAKYNEWAFKITSKGLDAIAFHDLQKNKVVKKLLNPIGMGKEAEVYLALDFDDNPIVVKKHLFDRAKFKKIAKSLAYASIKWRAKQLGKKLYEINVPRAKAQIESYVLEKLYYMGFHVPKPISINRHIVVMEAILDNGFPAKQLSKLKPDKELGLKILEEYDNIVKKAKIVHGDLSPFNILVKGGEYYFIDWAQAVPSDYEEANILYKRDIENIKKFFHLDDTM